MVNKENRYVSLFLGITFLLPLIAVWVQAISTNALLKFVFYGIQAASPTIAALIVLRISGTCKEFGVKYFHFKHLLKASVLPVLIACFTMFMAKLIFCFVE